MWLAQNFGTLCVASTQWINPTSADRFLFRALLPSQPFFSGYSVLYTAEEHEKYHLKTIRRYLS